MKVKTMDISGKEYAKVADRMKQFREENPKGKVDTSFTQLPDGQMVLKAEITKEDGSVATGQAMGKLGQAKAFEKLESIAVGRALAFLGYMASGEIASSEEMEEFFEYKNEKKAEAEVALKKCETIEELKSTFLGLGSGLMADQQIIAIKDTLKTQLK
jgi:hypothetical protein